MAKKLFCNKCGKPMDDQSFGVSIIHYMGYGSKHDGDCMELDLCVSCLDELADSCVISPVDLHAMDGVQVEVSHV